MTQLCRSSPLFTEGRRHTLIGYEGECPELLSVINREADSTPPHPATGHLNLLQSIQSNLAKKMIFRN